MMLSDVWCLCVGLSVSYIGPKSRTERPRKTTIGTEVAHVTCDSDTTFKVKRSKVNLQGTGGILWRPRAQLVTSYERKFDAQNFIFGHCMLNHRCIVGKLRPLGVCCHVSGMVDS